MATQPIEILRALIRQQIRPQFGSGQSLKTIGWRREEEKARQCQIAAKWIDQTTI